MSRVKMQVKVVLTFDADTADERSVVLSEEEAADLGYELRKRNFMSKKGREGLLRAGPGQLAFATGKIG